jgi:hypothetical protein
MGCGLVLGLHADCHAALQANSESLHAVRILTCQHTYTLSTARVRCAAKSRQVHINRSRTSEFARDGLLLRSGCASGFPKHRNCARM